MVEMNNMKRPPRYTGQKSQRKIYGFDFYIRANDKLKREHREMLLRESEHHLSEVREIHPDVIVGLDSSHSDWELLDQWNYVYVKHGIHMSKFRDKWEKEIKGGKVIEKELSVMDEIQKLNDKMEMLETELKNLKNNWVDQTQDLNF